MLDMTPAQMEQNYPLDDVSEPEKKITRTVWQLQLQHNETLLQLATSAFRQQLILLIIEENALRDCSNISAELVEYFYTFEAIMDNYLVDFAPHITKDSVIGKFEYDCLIQKRAAHAPAILKHYCTETEINAIVKNLPM
jgi:hypothetical protein